MRIPCHRRRFVRTVIAAGLASIVASWQPASADDQLDFGLKIEHLLQAQSETLLGIEEPVKESAFGPYNGADGTLAVIAAKGLHVSVVSNATYPMSDQIALWPNNVNPTHAFVCVEDFFSGNDATRASLQRVDLNGNSDSNVEVTVKGISSCDPVRRTAWGSIVVGEESGPNGGFYEIMNPMSLSGSDPAVISDRAAGTSNKPNVVKRTAIGNMSWEGVAILEDGTMYFGDEKRPSNGKPGGAIYKFVPTVPYQSWNGLITNPALSPLASGTNYGMRLGTRSGNTDYGQGSETGRGVWMEIAPASYVDVYGNINLGLAQRDLGLTGYYRPEDMDRDPIAADQGVVKVCWINTGRMTNGLNSAIENGHLYGEVICMVDEPVIGAPSNASPVVKRFVSGDRDMNHFDNIAFQPHRGNVVLLEDGEVEVRAADGNLVALRGNDVWACLPNGGDRDVMTDGCVRILSLADTSAEPTGLIFDARGDTAYLNIQHRAGGKGAMLKVTGFKLKHNGSRSH